MSWHFGHKDIISLLLKVQMQANRKHSMGLRMDDNTLRVSVGLHLWIPICGSHACQHCGCAVDTFGRPGLSCKRMVTIITITVPSMMLSREPSSQLMFLAGLNLWVCFIVMVNILMVLPGTLEVWSIDFLGCHLPRQFHAFL